MGYHQIKIRTFLSHLLKRLQGFLGVFLLVKHFLDLTHLDEGERDDAEPADDGNDKIDVPHREEPADGDTNQHAKVG